jgi:hypothetical protein
VWVEQLVDRDLVALGNETGQPALDAIAQTQLALSDELQDDGRDVGLRQAGDAVVVGRLHRCLRGDLGKASGQARRLGAIANEQDRPWSACGDEGVDILL